MIEKFSKIANFITYHKTNDVMDIANLFFRDVVKLHGIPKTIFSDRDVNFFSHF